MFVTSKRRKCCNDPDIFCYICGCVTLPPQRRNINSFIKKIYLAYFGIPLGDQDKSWAPHTVCTTCVQTLKSWSQGKKAKLKFCVPKVWREPKNHVDDCYFCLINVKEFNKKNKQHLQYPNMHSAMRPIPHSDKVHVPIFIKLPDIDEDQPSTSSTNSDDDDEEQDIAHKTWNVGRVSLYSQSELNDLIRDLNFPKQSAEVLASRLQEKHLFKAGTRITGMRNKESTFSLMSSLFTVQMLRASSCYEFVCISLK